MKLQTMMVGQRLAVHLLPAPQLAGICALVKQACPRLSPSRVRDILRKTARDVTTGNCHPNTGGHAAVTRS